ncbi:hypothetical protein KC19_3G036300 [Ceratodon purpureus]|uniref:Triosephosphate isomerase n=1 Tax=Ceratodon purpureus TaxID=3225 RepID=A0A8T0IGJ8_CERPU|nr:hypothetical protein KC19_3G036300 [Ceratodon purpureus]
MTQFEENEEYGDEHPDDIVMCVCVDYDENGDVVNSGGYGTNVPTMPIGDPPVTSCYLLIKFLDDALNMMRSLQYVTVGLMSKLDDMQEDFLYEDLFEKLRWHANCYHEWQEADTSKFLESQQAVIESARTLCIFFMDFSRMHTIGSRIFPVYVPPTGRKFFLGGNWKCNGSKDSIKKLVDELNAADFDDDVDIVVCPSYVYLTQVVGSLTKRIDVAAQNCWRGEGGAFTGEISADQLVDVGVKWVVAGHAERRHILGETNTVVALKCAYAISLGLNVIIAVGETLFEREQNLTNDVIFEQLQSLTSKIADWTKVVLAYEPVWAIGTGKACSPEEAQEVHLAIREWMKKNTSEEVSSSLRIIYGASVSSSTCNDLAKQHDIDGFFVGGAAWDGKEFAAIANSVKVKKNIDFAVEQMMSLGEEPEPSWPEFLESLLKLRALAMKRFSTSLFEEECLEAYRANLEGKYDNAKAINVETTAQLEAARAQREAEYNAYLDDELQIVRDGEQSTLQAELAEKQMLQNFKAHEDQEFDIFNAEYSVLEEENVQMGEKLLDMQNLDRTWELQQRGKNGQSAEEVSDLMWVFEHDTKEKTTDLAEKREENDKLGAHLNKMIMYFVQKDREAARVAEEKLRAAYAICDKKRKKWLPYYAACRIQRYWKRYLWRKSGGVGEPTPAKKGKGGKGGKKGKKGKK